MCLGSSSTRDCWHRRRPLPPQLEATAARSSVVPFRVLPVGLVAVSLLLHPPLHHLYLLNFTLVLVSSCSTDYDRDGRGESRSSSRMSLQSLATTPTARRTRSLTKARWPLPAGPFRTQARRSVSFSNAGVCRKTCPGAAVGAREPAEPTLWLRMPRK